MTILITGARGTIARSLIRQLVAAGHEVRAATRSPAPLAGLAHLPSGVDVTRVDFSAPATFASVLDGVRAVFLYAERDGLGEFLRHARTAGVEHAVLLSAASADASSADPLASMHGKAEEEVAASDLAWTFLRPGGFATNTLQWAGTIRSHGTVRDPFPDARSAPVHEADIASVALHALTGPGHRGAVHLLTGPEVLTRRRQAELIGEVVGRTVAFEIQDLDEHRRDLARWGPPEIAEALVRNAAEAVHAPVPVSPAVEQITGHPARTFATWATDHAADFAG
ncbi:NAD(P)H-binding protein [Actinomadura fibrosa]|uniref:NAD(P)H-binding protein n=1 Tax=Actinomadura fibrosa TaxID=111802 RepID=A0ABW2XS32_9ACTN|nr:NAD(P)H-binding protein [Actinomadura fibrosa]